MGLLATSQNTAAAQMQSCSSTVQGLHYSSCGISENDAATGNTSQLRGSCAAAHAVLWQRSNHAASKQATRKGQQILLTGQTNFAEGLQTELKLGAKNCKGRALTHLGNFDRMTYKLTTNRTASVTVNILARLPQVT